METDYPPFLACVKVRILIAMQEFVICQQYRANSRIKELFEPYLALQSLY